MLSCSVRINAFPLEVCSSLGEPCRRQMRRGQLAVYTSGTELVSS